MTGSGQSTLYILTHVIYSYGIFLRILFTERIHTVQELKEGISAAVIIINETL
jgi:hypothetical protein